MRRLSHDERLPKRDLQQRNVRLGVQRERALWPSAAVQRAAALRSTQLSARRGLPDEHRLYRGALRASRLHFRRGLRGQLRQRLLL